MTNGDWAEFGGKLTQEEFMCKCGDCGIESANEMQHYFMHSLYLLRLTVDKPFGITSGYRCENHPRERAKFLKGKPFGDHTKGVAVDIAGGGFMPVVLTQEGKAYGFNVFGWKHKGEWAGRFTHLAKREGLVGVIGYTY